MKTFSNFALAAALVATAACNKQAPSDNATTEMAPITATPVAAPNNGDWSETITATPEGGFLMGNPSAKVKLVEFGSMTCPHCREFDETGAGPLIENYIKKGLVAWEFRNFVRDPLDMTASLVARCNGPAGFFGITRSLYADQMNWVQKVQAVDEATLNALASKPPQEQFKAYADMTGFPAFAALRGVPRAKTSACLADAGAATKLVQMNADAVSQYNIPGTPSFLINGKMVENAAAWSALEPELRKALGS